MESQSWVTTLKAIRPSIKPLTAVAVWLMGTRSSEAGPSRGQRRRAEGTFGASPRWEQPVRA